ncbi:hypothetical protein P8C59_008845 [Phyllachora maydis]|uniref:Uncharacterized protein n=1 Tax=Phyllachora maydis TaxID=1825666 RepID=A0AAD9MKE3_9PEZI|nr:hypothetical protein P8C59_008845 [Phyllachora maydis]
MRYRTYVLAVHAPRVARPPICAVRQAKIFEFFKPISTSCLEEIVDCVSHLRHHHDVFEAPNDHESAGSRQPARK